MENKFFEASPDCVKLLSLDGEIQYVNANGLQLLEFEACTEMVGRNWIDLWQADQRDRVQTALRNAAQGRAERFTAFCPTAKGVPKWWDVVVSPVIDAAGVIEAVLATSRDVSNLVTYERTLAENEQRLRALANTIPQLAWMADVSGDIFWFNDRWFEYTGSTFEAMKGVGWRAVQHPDHLDRVARKFLDNLRRGEEWEDVFPIRRADGEYRWFLSRAMPVLDAEGRPAFYCGTNTDISDQRNQSQRLRQLARIVELSHEAILIWDMADGIVSWNRGCEELYGYPKSRALGAIPHRLLGTRHPIPAEDFERLLLAQGSWSGELLHLAEDGSEVWVDSRQELIRVGGKRLVLETNRDVTERRQSDEVRDLLVAELNHRIKNTLAIVQSIAGQTAKNADTVEGFVASFTGRLHSLANAHTILTDADWIGASMRKLVQGQLSLHNEASDRVTVSGEDVFLPPQIALQFALILHELSTNAARHGALSSSGGTVDIAWHIKSDAPGGSAGAPVLEFVWREKGVPKPKLPTSRRGFGLSFIERSGRHPNLSTNLKFTQDGIELVATATLLKSDESIYDLFNPGKKLRKLRVRSGASADTSPRLRIMLVEREPRDSMILEDMLYEAGYVTIGPVATPSELRWKLDMVNFDLAIVDADGVRAEVEEMLEILSAKGVPCVVVGSVRRLAEAPDLGGDRPRLTKPLQPQILLSTLATTIAGSLQRPPTLGSVDGRRLSDDI